MSACECSYHQEVLSPAPRSAEVTSWGTHLLSRGCAATRPRMQVLRQAGCSAYVQLLAQRVPLGHQRSEVAQQGVARLQQQSLLLLCQAQALLQARQNLQLLVSIPCTGSWSGRPCDSSSHICRGVMGAVLHCKLTGSDQPSECCEHKHSHGSALALQNQETSVAAGNAQHKVESEAARPVAGIQA